MLGIVANQLETLKSEVFVRKSSFIMRLYFTGCPRIALTLPSFDVMQQKKFCNPKVFLSSIYFRL
jgi:hypothetical protein